MTEGRSVEPSGLMVYDLVVANGGRKRTGDAADRDCTSPLVTFSQLHRTFGVKKGKTELWLPCSPITSPLTSSKYSKSSLEFVASGSVAKERLFVFGEVENCDTLRLIVVSVHPPLLNVAAARLKFDVM